jgi:hypothetical protein
LALNASMRGKAPFTQDPLVGGTRYESRTTVRVEHRSDCDRHAVWSDERVSIRDKPNGSHQSLLHVIDGSAVPDLASEVFFLFGEQPTWALQKDELVLRKPAARV